jgi:hypothetical protein
MRLPYRDDSSRVHVDLFAFFEHFEHAYVRLCHIV